MLRWRRWRASIRAALIATGRGLRSFFDDDTILAFGGLGLMAIGLSFVSATLALVVPGAGLFYLGTWHGPIMRLLARHRGG